MPQYVPAAPEVKILAGIVLVTAIAAMIALSFTGFLLCGQDSSACPRTSAKNGHFTGIVRSESGRVLRSTEVFVDLNPVDHQIVDTDRAGRACVVWAGGGNQPTVRTYPDSGRVAPTTRLTWTENADSPAPPGCTRLTATIPWNKADSLDSDPRFIAPGVLAGGAILLLLPALAGVGPGRRGRYRGNVAAGLSVALSTLAWAGIVVINSV